MIIKIESFGSSDMKLLSWAPIAAICVKAPYCDIYIYLDLIDLK